MNRRFFRIPCFAALVSVLLCLCLCACGRQNQGSFAVSAETTDYTSSECQFRSYDKKNLAEAASDGEYKLLCDCTSASIAVADRKDRILFSALPSQNFEGASVLYVTLEGPGGKIILDSSVNCVFFDTFSVDYTDCGVSITYNLFTNAADASSGPSENTVWASVPVLYELRDGDLTVSINRDEILCGGGYFAESIALMPCFGANTSADKNNYRLVPDGEGALIKDRLAETRLYAVYEQNSDTAFAPGAYFGVRNNSAAFAAVSCCGEEGAVITASTIGGKLNAVYPVFAVTRTEEKDGILYRRSAGGGNLSVCYRFLDKNCGFEAMAVSVREYYLRNGYLSKSQTSLDDMPVNIEIVCSADGSYKTRASGFEDIEDAISIIRAKGASKINLILNGPFGGGLVHRSTDSLKLQKKLGGENDFELLKEYCSKQSTDVYVSVPLFTAKAADAEKGVALRKTELSVINPLAPYIGRSSYGAYLLDYRKVEAVSSDAAEGLYSLGVNGAYIPDAGACAEYARPAAELRQCVASLSVKNKLIVSDCCFNVLCGADYVTNVPSAAFYEETGGYKAVPFVQLVLRTVVGYSCEAVNTGDVFRLGLLRSVLNGEIPYFRWVLSMKSHLYYGLTVNDVCDFLTRSYRELDGLGTLSVLSFEELESGLYAVSYENGSVVYVNFNNYSVNTGKLSVPPYDYLRIN